MNRARWLRLHKYIGLAMAALLLVQAVTGMLLLYRGPVARWIDPAGMTSHGAAPAISAGTAVAGAERALPGFAVARLFAPDGEGATYVAEMTGAQGTRYASVDPAGGTVLRAGPVWAFPVEAALQLHYRLMAGKAGMAVVLLNTLALLAMAGTGLAYWWPKKGPVSKQLSIRWNMAFRLVLRQLHRTAGVLMSVLLGFMAVTGLLLVVPELIGADAPPLQRPAANAMAIDRSLGLAQSAFPDSVLRDFRLTDERLIANFHAPERNPRAVHRAIVTLAAPHIVSATRAENNGALWMSVLPLHAGNSFGLIGPVAVMLIALSLIALTLTGPLMWWQARAVRRRSTARKQMA